MKLGCGVRQQGGALRLASADAAQRARAVRRDGLCTGAGCFGRSQLAGLGCAQETTQEVPGWLQGMSARAPSFGGKGRGRAGGGSRFGGRDFRQDRGGGGYGGGCARLPPSPRSIA